MDSTGLDRYVALDAAGFLPGPGESASEFEQRIAAIEDAHRQFEKELQTHEEVVVFEEVKVRNTERIPPEITAEAEEVTSRLYDFKVRHVPGFFLSRDVGVLWGGCMITDTELPLSFFLIRGAFRTRRRWLFYDRRELLAHELCHSMRHALRDVPLEEYFAYQTSPSLLRRYLGNCFIRDYDAILFIVPTFFLLGAVITQGFLWPNLPVWPFWLLALAYPFRLLCRNARARRQVARARRNLLRFGVSRPGSVLFRCTTPEIVELGRLPSVASFKSWLDGKQELRWQIIRRRFLNLKTAAETDPA